MANDEYRHPYIVNHKIIDKLLASWAIDSEPIRARGIYVKESAQKSLYINTVVGQKEIAKTSTLVI